MRRLLCALDPVMAAVSPHAFHVSERLQQLAEPKKVKDVWNYSSRLVWGNQETIWPLPRRAVTGLPPARILDLAKPKKNFAQKPQPRPSIVLSYEIWEHPMNTHDSMPSERILHLSEPKQCSPVYLEQRPRSSPLWHINPPALSCTPSQRILNLSQPRTLSPSFILPKEVETPVSHAARTASASPRMHHLSQPIVKKIIPHYENRFVESPIRKVSPAALQAIASPRLAELSRPRALPAESCPDRSAEWPVSRAAMKVMASPRIGELAQRPARASTNFVQFNPEAFTVKETAINARCTDRLRKLAEPIMR
ncbi:sperm microtubule associated protein 2-like isoform X2 [Paroedura picta]|uniref:sperm microtubule associated protein 2-like isoform X2 n=1 Tax=Paroedura picta TaxID=143630 RepID=UPI004057C42A